jgi:hypothetical protein
MSPELFACPLFPPVIQNLWVNSSSLDHLAHVAVTPQNNYEFHTAMFARENRARRRECMALRQQVPWMHIM